MQHLRNLVYETNLAIAARLKETARLNGLVRQVRRQTDGGTEITLLDNLNNPVIIDDRWSINLWHRVTEIQSEQLTGQGRGNKYRFDAQMLLICSATRETTHDVLVFILTKQKNIVYKSSDFDAASIIRQETGKNDVNIDKPLFQINYTLSYLSEKCFEECEIAEIAPRGTVDCIEVSQGGILTP